MSHSGQARRRSARVASSFHFLYSLNCLTLSPSVNHLKVPCSPISDFPKRGASQPLRYSSHVPPSSGIINRRRYLGRLTYPPPPNTRRDLRPFFQLYPEARRNKNRGNCTSTGSMRIISTRNKIQAFENQNALDS